MKITITKVNSSYEFEGYILDENLTDKYLKLFEIDPNRELCDEIKVNGEFSIDWDNDDIANVIIESMYFSNGNKEIDIDPNEVNIDKLSENIMDKCNYMDLVSDRIAAHGDYLYDSNGDR